LAGVFVAAQRFLERLDLRGLHALRAALRGELDALAFLERAETGALDLLEVREEVFAAAFRSDEAKALGLVKALNGAGGSIRHITTFLSKDTGEPPAGCSRSRKGSRVSYTAPLWESG